MMASKFNINSTSGRYRAFTLVEMLVVIAVIGLITAAVAPMVFGTLVSTRLSSSGQTMMSAMSLAHEMAISGGEDIEVRFYRYTVVDEPGSGDYFRSIILVRPGKLAGEPGLQLGEIIKCPSGIIVGDTQALSPVLASGDVKVMPDSENLIRSARANYKAFRFRADGSTDLNFETNKCYFTLLEERLLQASAGVPPNFYAIQIDPVSGRLASYRP
jgi:uncharacterized protein (TIGR02596 family)